MSDADRAKWDKRYAEGAYQERTHAADYLQQMVPRCSTPGQLALDVACGAGRNTLYLAQLGFQAVGTDISQVGLQRARHHAGQAGLAAEFLCLDLDRDELPEGPYDLIIVFRFVAVELMPALSQRLSAGGMLVMETHLQWPDPVAGPSSARYRIAPGTLTEQASRLGLTIEHSYEGLLDEPGGGQAAVARLTAIKPYRRKTVTPKNRNNER